MHKEQNGRTKIHHTKDIQSTRLIQIQKPRGHKEERASFPNQSQYKVSKIHTPNPTPREEEGRKNREGGRRTGEGAASTGRQAGGRKARKKEREG